MLLEILLFSVTTAIKCNNRISIDSLEILCPSKNGILKNFWFNSKRNSVPERSCEDAASDLKMVHVTGYPIQIKDLCDYENLAILDAIDCTSVGGILHSFRYKIFNYSFKSKNTSDCDPCSLYSEYKCASIADIGDCSVSKSFIENGVGCESGFFLQKFQFKVDSKGKIYSENKCSRVDSLKSAQYVSSKNLQPEKAVSSWLQSSNRLKKRLASSVQDQTAKFSWISPYKQGFSVSVKNFTGLIGQRVTCGPGETLNYLDFQ
jgi:hypothetical protein